MKEIPESLTNAQLEILKAFSFNLSEEELKDFKELIAQFFAKRAVQQANQHWEENDWNDETIDELLQTKMRKSNKA